MKKKAIIYTLLSAFMSMVLVACDKESENSSQTVVYGTSTSSAMLSSFKLKPNNKVLAHLDSVRFTIDQKNRLIYNADSLPMGTDVTKLTTSVTFASTVSKSQYVISDGTRIKDETTIDYSDTSTDSIDFTGKVTLNVTSHDGTKVMSYRVKVNVHQVQPDSIQFPLSARRDLPAAADENYALGMAQLNGMFYCMVKNSNGSYVGEAATPAGKWSTEKVALPFTPVEGTLTASSEALYVLDTDGNLYTSQDAREWNATGVVWKALLGGYDNRVLGITSVDGVNFSDEYPHRADFKSTALPAKFPVTGFSQLAVANNDWSLNPIAIMVGGRDADGVLSNASWGYDGKSWAQLNAQGTDALPALEGVTLATYYTYDVSAYNQSATPKTTWVVMGGRTVGGVFNTTTYVSRNLGITWTKGASGIQLPNYMPHFAGALGFVCSETTSLKAPARVSKPITEWDVYCLYLVGGTGSNGQLLNNVWKGTIERMLFKPIY